MAPIHVDEATGSDETGKGTPEAPYQSLAFALYTHPDGAFQIRKDASTPYDEPTQSALKKAKKGADGIEKKKKKAEELAQREAKEKADARERKEKKLEESKKIVLQEDPSLPKATKVRMNRLCHSRARLNTAPGVVAGENHQPYPPPHTTRPRIWMGTSASGSERDHFHRPPRWHWLPAVCPIWTGRADIRSSHPHPRVDSRSRRHAQGRAGGPNCSWWTRVGCGLLEGARCSAGRR